MTARPLTFPVKATLRPPLVLALWILGACSGDSPAADAGGTCPASYTVGDPCLSEGLRCPYATSRCGLKCTCTGGLWLCRTQWCECSCSCGRILKSSCELLECSPGATHKCPSAASKHCEVLCWDAGTPDAGLLDRGADVTGVDSGPDGPRDHGPEAAPDRSLDLPPPDQTPDAPADTTADTKGDHTPDAPAKDDNPDAPAADMTPDAPAADMTADAPAADLTQDAPAADMTADAPAADMTADAPAADTTGDLAGQ